MERHTKASAELAALLAGKDVALMGRDADLAALQRELAELRRELEAAYGAIAAVAPLWQLAVADSGSRLGDF